MTYRYYLDSSLEFCSIPWQNLIRYLQNGSDSGVDHSLIQQSLEPYYGTYIEVRNGGPCIDFNREEDASAFILRWS